MNFSGKIFQNSNMDLSMLNEMKGVMEKLSSGMEKMEPWDVVLLNL